MNGLPHTHYFIIIAIIIVIIIIVIIIIVNITNILWHTPRPTKKQSQHTVAPDIALQVADSKIAQVHARTVKDKKNSCCNCLSQNDRNNVSVNAKPIHKYREVQSEALKIKIRFNECSSPTHQNQPRPDTLLVKEMIARKPD